MNTIILSIHKQYCDLIFGGKKRFEFRKSVPSHAVSSILVYEAKGSGKIIGELTIEDALIGPPDEIWSQTKDVAGIDKESFFNYYRGKQKVVAYVIKSAHKYEKPKSLSDFGISRPPQNYIWVKD